VFVLRTLARCCSPEGRSRAFVLLIAGIMMSAAPAVAAPPLRWAGGVDSGRPIAESHGGAAVLYVNRCIGGDSYAFGVDDSRANSSSLVPEAPGTVTLAEFPYGDESWGLVISELESLFAAYQIEVTDTDPGQIAHHEIAICGSGVDLGLPASATGTAPAICGDPLENSVTFTFPSTIGEQPRLIAERAAQEAAHAWGLEHTTDCADIMSNAAPCGDRTFVNREADCGDAEPAACQCGSATTQNSHARLVQLFNEDSEPPLVEITYPEEDAEVPVGVELLAVVSDPDGFDLAQVDFLIDGELVDTRSVGPFVFKAPESILFGEHELSVRATDWANDVGSATVNVRVVAQPRGPGEPCEVGGGQLCESGVCLTADQTTYYCVDSCVTDADCDLGMSCVNDMGGAHWCWPATDQSVDASPQGCVVGIARRRDGQSLPILMLFALPLVATAAHRRRCRSRRR